MVTDSEGRTVFPAAEPKHAGTNVPMPADAAEESSPSDAPAASSAEETPQVEDSQEGTAPSTPQEPEKKWHLPPEQRWEELRQQRQQAEERAAKAEQLAQLALQKLQTPVAPVQPDVDPYAGMSAEEAASARWIDKRIDARATALAEQKLQGVLQTVDAGRRELAELKIAQFRKDNPDIKPGSPEEAMIASYVQQGIDLNSAKKLALYDKLETEVRALKSKQSGTPRKAAANVETSSGIPNTAGLPGRPSHWTDTASKVVDEGGGMRDVANALFGRKPKP